MVSCGSTSYDAPALNLFVQDADNGLIKMEQRKGYDLQLYNRPTDLWVAQELRNEIPMDSLINSMRDKYDNYLYFILKISKEGKSALYSSSDFGNFSTTLQNLSFRMAAFTQMVTSARDTIPLADSHYDRLYGQAGSTSVMIAFSKEKLKDTEWVQVSLLDIGLGIGKTYYRFKTKDLLNAPQIDFKRTIQN